MSTRGFGARPREDGVEFRVWAPSAQAVEVVFEPDGRAHSLERREAGLFGGYVPGARAGALYRYRLDAAATYPDPASRFQPHGVHGPSMVVDPAAYAWRDGGWRGVARRDLVFYELHVGTFTTAGSFDALRAQLSYLRDLGVTAIELMPVADFPGERNWGYDPAALYAPSRAYGTPDALRHLVDDAHLEGLAVVLDVVYNHLGPDGAYLPAIAPSFFTDRHATPWGKAVNLDDDGSEQVRSLLIDNALHWLLEYHLDGLRLDATHALVDDGDPHFLAALAEAVESAPAPKRFLIAEDHRNLRRLIEPRERGGYGLDAVWADDFHHQVRRITAGDSEGYFRDFAGGTRDLARTLRQGWLFTGQHSRHEGGPRGTDPTGLAQERFVLCIQNHDQIGNRAQGERLTDEISSAAYHAATAVLLFAPELPLLFMGQEWAARTPFLYFTDHEAELGTLVTEGRRTEFAEFARFAREDVPDPQDPETFERSKLDWRERESGDHARTLRLYRDLLTLRRSLHGDVAADAPVEGGLVLRRGRHLLLAALAPDVALPVPSGSEELWRSQAERYAVEPAEIAVRGGRVHFSAPGALWLEMLE